MIWHMVGGGFGWYYCVGLGWCGGILGVLSSVSQYSKVLVIWFLMRFVVETEFK